MTIRFNKDSWRIYKSNTLYRKIKHNLSKKKGCNNKKLHPFFIHVRMYSPGKLLILFMKREGLIIVSFCLIAGCKVRRPL